jgi:RNA polymerase sigma factor (sigma-70 family)
MNLPSPGHYMSREQKRHKAINRMADLGQHLQRLALRPDGGAASDAELLERFLSNREEAAFEVLVRRHGPIVLGVCRRLLGDHHLAEDAFQATFLVLVRKAGAIRKRRSIASWLYGVAYRTAAKARVGLSRQRMRERPMRDLPSRQTQESSWQELRPLLDDELQRLSEIYRTPVVLCDLEGKTRKEAARLVGCPEGTLSTRLMRARALLAKRLLRRGVALSEAFPGLVMSQPEASACVPSTLLVATTKAAGGLAIGQTAGLISPQVAALTQGVLRNMLWTSFVKGVTFVLAAGLLCGGLTLVSYRLRAGAGDAEGASPQLAAGQPAQQAGPAQDHLRERVNHRITLDRGIDPNTQLKDVMEFLADRYDLTIAIDSERFKAAGQDNVEEQPVRLPEQFHVRLRTVLRKIARQVNGVCLLSAGKVVLVPNNDKIVKEMIARGAAALPEGVPDEDSKDKAFELAIRAYRKTVAQLRSGTGTGSYEVYRSNDRESRLMRRATFTLHFDHKRFYLSLRYDKHEEGLSRLILIRDNSATYSSGASNRAAPWNHWGEVLDLEVNNREFAWNPSQVARPLLNVERWVSMGGDNMEVEELPEDGYEIQTQTGKVHASCAAFKQFDWNIALLKTQVAGPGTLEQDQATWKKAGEVWYANSREKTERRVRSVLRIDHFKANVAVSPKLFHLAALELPVGAEIVDAREDGPVRTYLYQAIPEGRGFFDMEAELESLPVRP